MYICYTEVTMATGTPSPTPSEDNRKNNRDDTMYSALDKVMGNSVQSYEDFLNSFTFLKTGIVVIMFVFLSFKITLTL
jgi:hypothetical protein